MEVGVRPLIQMWIRAPLTDVQCCHNEHDHRGPKDHLEILFRIKVCNARGWVRHTRLWVAIDRPLRATAKLMYTLNQNPQKNMPAEFLNAICVNLTTNSTI
jgi:hypothetical protein